MNVMDKYYLPIGILIGCAVAMFQPSLGTVAYEHHLVPITLVIIFFLSGTKIKLSEFKLTPRFAQTIAVCAMINLFAAPLLASIITTGLDMETAFKVGLIVTAIVPPTLSSGVVITEIAKGNGNLALALTIILNVMGIVTIPFLLPYLLTSQANLSIDSMPLLIKLIKLVLIPLLIGYYFKKRVPAKFPTWVSFVPTTCVILTVWMILSIRHETFSSLNLVTAGYLILIAAAFHWTLVWITMRVSKHLKFPTKDQKAAIFVCSQKTLPVAITIYYSLPENLYPAHILGTAMLVTLFYHFLQIIIDSLMANMWAAKAARLELEQANGSN